MGNKTPLYEQHQQSGAKLVDFGGWDMPIHYGSQLEEHKIVRQTAGAFDVSHMTVIDIDGKESRAFLRNLLANDVNKLTKPGKKAGINKALYTAMLNPQGKILDDLIVYQRDGSYRLVTNCATREKDLKWIREQAQPFDCRVQEQPDLAIIAVQGPDAIRLAKSVLPAEDGEFIDGLGSFESLSRGDLFIATTGYTGERGLEFILPSEAAPEFWKDLLKAGVSPIGLGARDTLRLEAGMNLYGSDMDESVTPLESNMGWTLAFSDDRDFVGKGSLCKQLDGGVTQSLIGLIMTDKGVLRSGYPVFLGDSPVGNITSGIFSPTLGHSIALARVRLSEAGVAEINSSDKTLQVEIRNKLCKVEIVRPPFVRNGKKVYKKI